MTRSESLAEKYERSKRGKLRDSDIYIPKYKPNSYEDDLIDFTYKPKASFVPSPKYPPSIERPNRVSYTATSDKLNKGSTSIPYLSEIKVNSNKPLSPIKRVRFTPSRIRPAQIYKVLNSEASAPTARSILYGSRYNSKSSRNSVSVLNPQKRGLFNRLRKFLTNLTVNGGSTGSSDFELLSNSAKDLLHINLPAKRVNFNDEVMPREKERVSTSTPLRTPIRREEHDYAGDHDLVDETIRLNSELQKKKEIQQRVNVLLDKIEEEKLNFRSLTANYEHEISSLKAEYENKLRSMKSRILQLEKDADVRNKHLEQAKIQEIRTEILKEHEAFLIRQRRKEEELEFKQQMLNSEYERLKEEKSENENLRDAIDRKNQQLITSIKQRRSDLKHELFNKLESNKKEFEAEFQLLQQQKLSIESNIDSHETDFVEFNERVQKMSEEILHKKQNYSLQEVTFLKGLEHLLDTLAKVEEKNRLGSRYNHQYVLIDAKLKDYSIFFQNFLSVFNTNSTGYLEVYNQDNLNGIKLSFQKLTLNLKKKFLKKNSRLKQLDNDIARFQIKLSNGDIPAKLGDFDFEKVLISFQTRFEVLEELRTINHLLMELSSLCKELTNISIIIQDNLDKTDDII